MINEAKVFIKEIKRVIAREGLIILGLSVVLYFFILLFKNVPVALPKYRLEFVSGEICTITINPELNNDSDYNRLLREAYNPPPKLVEKRIKEFIRAGNIKSALKSSTYINPIQIYISKLYSELLGVMFVLKLAIIYIIFLIARFIIWALKILRGHST